MPAEPLSQGHNLEANGDGEPDDQPEAAGDEQACPYCFLLPCVTTLPHVFLGPGQQPCDNNSGIHKDKYRKYWMVINNLGGWNIPRYLAKKVQVANGGQWAVIHKREVMPECVLKQVRGLYPNPHGRPYLGHMWE